MKLLLDQGLPRSAAKLLNDTGINAIHVGDIGFHSAEDSEIIRKAREENRIIVTVDADFHALLALENATSPSVIRIRIEGLRAQAVAELIQIIIDQCGEDLEKGAVATVEPNRIRTRRLPLLK
jgi:predicted nuclease of predicted toxin-antitoxin system